MMSHETEAPSIAGGLGGEVHKVSCKDSKLIDGYVGVFKDGTEIASVAVAEGTDTMSGQKAILESMDSVETYHIKSNGLDYLVAYSDDKLDTLQNFNCAVLSTTSVNGLYPLVFFNGTKDEVNDFLKGIFFYEGNTLPEQEFSADSENASSETESGSVSESKSDAGDGESGIVDSQYETDAETAGEATEAETEAESAAAGSSDYTLVDNGSTYIVGQDISAAQYTVTTSGKGYFAVAKTGENSKYYYFGGEEDVMNSEQGVTFKEGNTVTLNVGDNIYVVGDGTVYLSNMIPIN